MNEKFFELKKEKQDRMINAALKVFAAQGYRHASTDDIVKEAGISKGLLFHYFESKLGVYSFVYEYSVRYMTMELRNNIAATETEPFTILMQMEQAKLQALKGYPHMQQFLNCSFSENVKEALVAVEELKAAYSETLKRIYAQMDFSGLREGIDSARLLKIVQFTLDGLMNESFADASFQPDMLYRELAAYVELIKKMAVEP